MGSILKQSYSFLNNHIVARLALLLHSIQQFAVLKVVYRLIFCTLDYLLHIRPGIPVLSDEPFPQTLCPWMP
jgi:hypothetical protein